MFIARLIMVAKEDNNLDFVLVIQNTKSKKIIYREVLVTTENHYISFRLARGDMEWISNNTVAIWVKLGHKFVEVLAVTGKENYRIYDEHSSKYREGSRTKPY
jgi:hypothetical protein